MHHILPLTPVLVPGFQGRWLRHPSAGWPACRPATGTGGGDSRDLPAAELGIRRRVLSLDRPKLGWESLTDAELQVARLAAAGYTNRGIADRLFVSPHTVNTHLRHVFDKLDIRSRVDLTRVVEHHS
jgi:DNA-binding CsgD family transcriptional regulator